MAFSPSPLSAIPIAPAGRSMIQSRSPDQVIEGERARDRATREAEDGIGETVLPELTGYIRRQFDMMRDHRGSNAGWNERLLHAQRVFNREYDAHQLAAIREFGGADTYTGVTATKCRGATSLLREVYLGNDRPWGIDPTPEPTLPDGIADAIRTLVSAEMEQMFHETGQVNPEAFRDRVTSLTQAALNAAKKNARKEAKKAEDRVNDILTEGGYYQALADFLVDLPIFPFACIKGPVVRVVPQVKWVKQPNGRARAERQDVPKLFWERVSPFDIFFTPGVSDVMDADVIEINRFTRTDLNALIGVPGYDEDKIRAALRDYGQSGLKEWLDPTDSERARGENRENPQFNRSGVIDCLEFHGRIQGQMLLDWGMEPEDIPDADRDYFVQAWVVGRYTIKVQVNPSPRQRHPYYLTSFEKVPGTVVGNSVTDILSDIQDVCNAVIRTLVNNMSLASGPQVVVNDDRIAPGDDNDELYPWKRWHTTSDPFGGGNNARPPVEFFQPTSNAQELLVVYEKFVQQADELSAIPRYVTGSERMGGAGRTASGLAMLMGNANKMLQTVASNIDRDVIQQTIQGLYDMIMLTDESQMFRGDESISVRGVQVAVQRETDRQRQLELLQATANPIDMGIIGPLGRAKLLRSVSQQVGMEGDAIVPDEDELLQQLQQQAMVAQAQAQAAQEENVRQNGLRRQVTDDGKSRGVAPAQKPANTDLGVQDAGAMRGMAG